MKEETGRLKLQAPKRSPGYRGWQIMDGWSKWHWVDDTKPTCLKTRQIRTCNLSKPMGVGPVESEMCKMCLDLGGGNGRGKRRGRTG